MIQIARIIYALPIVVLGLFHFLRTNEMASMILKDWPLATVLVYISGAGLILGGISILIEKFVRLSSTLLAVEFLLFIVFLHVPGLFTSNFLISLTLLLKDMGLFAGALMIALTSEVTLYSETKQENKEKKQETLGEKPLQQN